ncbi:succinyl-diaminopimelate desuccinylase [Rubrobacter naiadicus]|uniref:succinyl-diaminopimelate desuccinylase n=1 Tax=Rubrobacter naiadicus TaxID=1392641 RepID=UPI002361B808|nr:succinyl-diaminopimelate desuccinylase [Rubrobacter naiadicus]
MRERLLEALLFFLERPSVTGEEKRLCDDLEARLAGSGLWSVGRTSNNLVVRRRTPDPSRPKLVFAGHLDTVPEPEGGIPVRVEGDEVYGRGASDMKGGDALMLALMENLDWDEARVDPLFVFYEREEGPHEENGLGRVFEEYPEVLEARLALIPEPTAGALEAGCAGTAQVEVVFRGRSAHAARPWLGENAISKAGGFLAALHERMPEEVEVEGLGFYEVLTPTLARGGVATNVVPDEFRINVNHRFAPGRGRDHVERTFAKLAREHGFSFEVKDFAAGAPPALGDPLLQELASETEVRAKQGWTDVARFAAAGVPAANYGPGIPEQAHQDEEHVKLSVLEGCYRRLKDYLSAIRRAI